MNAEERRDEQLRRVLSTGSPCGVSRFGFEQDEDAIKSPLRHVSTSQLSSTTASILRRAILCNVNGRRSPRQPRRPLQPPWAAHLRVGRRSGLLWPLTVYENWTRLMSLQVGTGGAQRTMLGTLSIFPSLLYGADDHKIRQSTAFMAPSQRLVGRRVSGPMMLDRSNSQSVRQ